MLHGVALERPIRRVEIEMEAEKQRLGFVENRDGNAGAIAFESYLAFKRYIETHNASFATRCTARSC